MRAPFVHLRVQSEYSLLDSVTRIEQLVQKAKELHMPALAITDQGTLSGAIPFYKACKREGIKPIIGCRLFLRDQEGASIHQISLHSILLLAENNDGYQNLLQLITRAHEKPHRGIPCVSKETLRHYASGLIALSSGLNGEIARLILANKREEAEEAACNFIESFGRTRFFFELQHNHQQEQQIVNRQFCAWAEKLSVGIVATNDVKYIHREDHEAHLCLSSIRTGSLYGEVREENKERSSHFKTPEEMEMLFADTPCAVENTLNIAKRCNVEIPLGKKLLPTFSVPAIFTSKTYLYELCKRGAKKRYAQITEEVQKRLTHELSVISEMNLEDYFLVVSDVVAHARKTGVAVGPGRGSAAGSLVCYVLGITDVDPIRYHLFFERFLNPERVSMPDIDLDFSDERREEIICYVKEKYGKDHVAQIVTFGTLAPRAAVRDVGRVMDIPHSKVDHVAKLIPSTSRTIVEAIRMQPKLKELVADDELNTLLKMVQKVEGLPRHVSTHAAGVIISGEPLTNHVPLQQGGAGIPLTQYSMEVLEDIGLLKVDFLGLRNLSVIERTKKILRKMGEEVVVGAEYDDARTYELLSQGHTVGVFQLESVGMRNVLKQVKPSCFEDVVAILALYRPGPMEQIPRFVRAKQGVEKVNYPHPDLEKILSTTYGVIVYQEQIIQIASEMAGFSLSQADTLRRAVSKKKEDDLQRQRETFVNGCVYKGYAEKTGQEVYDLIVRFANYGFNRSHSVAYGVLAYETAFLKANYPKAYMTALLTTVMGNQEKLGEYIGEVRRMGMKLLAPDMNESGYSFHVEEGGIRFGLGAIKYVGGQAVRSIMEAREEGPFHDMVDLCRRINLRICNRKTLESLIQCGSMDCFEGHRALKVVMLDEMIEEGTLASKSQTTLFESSINLLPDLNITPYSNTQKLAYELDLLGVYVSGHPLDYYNNMGSTHQVSEATTLNHKQKVCLAGVLIEKRVIKTKKGDQMAFCTLEDQTGCMEMVVFPRVLTDYRSILQEKMPLVVEGEVQSTQGDTKLIANRIKELREVSNLGVYIRLAAVDDAKLVVLKEALLSRPGEVPVYLFYERNKKLISLPVEKYGIAHSEECMEQLRRIVGKDAVYIKDREA